MIKKYLLNKSFLTYGYIALILAAPAIEAANTYVYYDMFNAVGSDNLNLVLTLMLKAIICFVIGGLFRYWIGVMRQTIIFKARTQLKEDYLGKLFEQDFSTFSQDNIGVHISSLTNDISLLEYKYFTGTLMLMEAILSITVTGVAIFTLGLRKTMVAIILIGEIVSIAVCFLAKKYSVRINNRFFDGLANFTESLKDFFSCFFLFKNYGVEDHIYENFRDKNNTVEGLKTDADVTVNFVFTLSKLCTSFLKFVVVGLGVIFLVALNGTFAEIYISYQFTGQIFSPTQNVITRINDINSVTGLVAKFKRILFGENEPQTKTVSEQQSGHEDRIQSVSFCDVSLQKGSKTILKHIDLTFEPKKKYLIIGRNGSGKSSMLRLLKGYDTQYTGKIMIDGAEMQTYDSESLSKKIVYINEQVSLFCDSVFNNITMYKDYSEQAVNDATQAAGLKVNLDRIISDGEINLSSGERRRIELARAYLSNAPVLVLDEAVSTLDIQTAYDIEKTMLDMEDRTVIFVSHNFSSSLIKKYDAIILLSDGQIVDVGTHEQLLCSSALYRNIIEIKSGKA
jgi:ABC-type multidrug transport system fused ATPase/permease subunit